MLAKMWSKGYLLTLLVGMQTGATTLEKSVEVLQKVKIKLPYEPAIALVGIYPKYTKILTQRDTIHPNVCSNIINNSQIIERSQVSIN